MRTLVVFLAASLAMSACAQAPGGVAPSPRPDAEARLSGNGVLSHNGSQLVAAGAGNVLPKAGMVSAGAGNVLAPASGMVSAGAGNAVSKAPLLPADATAEGAARPAGSGGSLVGNNGNSMSAGGADEKPLGARETGFVDLADFAPRAGFAIGAMPAASSDSLPMGPGPASPDLEVDAAVDVAIAGKLLAPGADGSLKPVGSVKARLFDLAGREIASAATGPDGAYSISAPGVTLGLHVVRAAFKRGTSEIYLAALVHVEGTAATADLDPGTTMLEAHLFAAAATVTGAKVAPPKAGEVAGWNRAAAALAPKVPATALAPGLSATERDALGAGLRAEAEKAFAGVAGLVVAR